MNLDLRAQCIAGYGRKAANGAAALGVSRSTVTQHWYRARLDGHLSRSAVPYKRPRHVWPTATARYEHKLRASGIKGDALQQALRAFT